MATLIEDIATGSKWTEDAFASLGKKMDYSLESIQFIEDFVNENVENGQPKPGSLMAQGGFGSKLFCFASYLGNTIIRNSKSTKWVTDDNDPEGEVKIQVTNGRTIAWPMQRVMKRMVNGPEDNLYHYAVVAAREMNKT